MVLISPLHVNYIMYSKYTVQNTQKIVAMLKLYETEYNNEADCLDCGAEVHSLAIPSVKQR